MGRMIDPDRSTHVRTSTGVHLPRFLLEPQSLSSKKDRERRNLRYMPPAPRPHHVRSAPSQTRLIHSRLGNEAHELDNSFQLLNSGPGGTGASFFRSNFEIQERLGFGSFGDVFRVKSKLDQKEYAVKKSRRVYYGEQDKGRQLREVNRITNISPNPHVVELETAWEEDGHLFLQLELCLKSLNQEIEEGSYPTEDEAWDVLIDMLYALQHLHKNLLVHMDVKPDNIFLTIDKPTKYKLGDFGIIICLKEKRDLTDFNEGDSRYLAPEVMQGSVSTKADVFSLGVTILEISCHLDLPKSGHLWQDLRNGKLPEPSNHLVPKSLEPVILKMITSNVEMRPEVDDILKMPEVVERVNRRKWMFRKAWFQRRWDWVVNFWLSIWTFLTSLVFTDKTKKNESSDEDLRRTPEPFPNSRDAPNVMLNDHSFSDDDEVTKTPVFASTPISISKTRSGGASRLRSSRFHRLGMGAEGDVRETGGLGSPSRNLLKEFEAVSD